MNNSYEYEQLRLDIGDEYSEKLLPIRRSRKFVEAKNNNNLIQNKILNFSIFVAQRIGTIGTTGVAEFRLMDMASYDGIDYESTRKELIRMRDSGLAVNRTFTIIDENSDRFSQFPLWQNFDYDRGKITVKFSEAAVTHLYELGSYSTIDASVSFIFKRDTTMRLYDLLTMYEYKLAEPGRSKFSIVFDLFELKFKIFQIDNFERLWDAAVSKKRGASITYKEFFDFYPDLEKYRGSWKDFRKGCLDVIKTELDEIALNHHIITFDYRAERYGRGGKVTTVRFDIHYLSDVNTEAEEVIVDDNDGISVMNNSSDMKPELIIEVMNIFKYNAISIIDVKSLIRAANGNIDKIQKAYDYMQEQGEIHNVIGWLTSCIQQEWYNSKNVSSYADLSFEDSAFIDEIYTDIYESSDVDESIDLEPETNERRVDLSDYYNMMESYMSDGKIELLKNALAEEYIVVTSGKEQEKSLVKELFEGITDELLNIPLKKREILTIIRLLKYDVDNVLDVLRFVSDNGVNTVYSDILDFAREFVEE